MRLMSFERNGKATLGVREGEQVRILGDETLESLLTRGIDLVEYASPQAAQERLAAGDLKLLPPLQRPPKIICVGLNFSDHTAESKYEQPDYPTLFFRVATSLIAHDQSMIRPRVSDSEGLDFEGEIAVVLEKAGVTLARLTHCRMWPAIRSSMTVPCANISSRRRSGPLARTSTPPVHSDRTS